MPARIYPAFLLLAGLSLAACSEQGLTGPSETSAFIIVLSAAPDPARAVASSGVTYELDGQIVEYDWTTSFVLIMRAPTAELVTRINEAGLVVRGAANTGSVATTPTEELPPFDFDGLSTEPTIGPGGETTVEITVWYSLPDGRPDALITLSLVFFNDDGVAQTANLELRIANTP